MRNGDAMVTTATVMEGSTVTATATAAMVSGMATAMEGSMATRWQQWQW